MMQREETDVLLTLSVRMYRLLLRAYPAPFRREFGREMALVFRDDLRATAHDRGAAALCGLWLLTFLDLLKTALVEHVWEAFHMPLEKLARWSGPAAVIGGPFYILGVIFAYGPNDSANGSVFSGVSLYLSTMLLLGLGIFGLHRRLSRTARGANRLAFGLALGGLFVHSTGSSALFLFPRWHGIWPAGAVLLSVGLAGMGLTTLSRQALERLSFAPLLVACCMTLMVVIAATEFSQNPAYSILNPLLLSVMTLYAIGWLLLGVALWRTQEDDAGPPLLA
jgi:hypothetical protein